MFGDEALAYAVKKHRGGVSGAKGSRYEDLFAVFLIADAVQRQWPSSDLGTVEAQVPMHFVDDVVLVAPDGGQQCCFQLKNSPSVSWEAGDHPIATDFERQHALSIEDGYERVSTCLVSSNRDVSAALEKSIPENIRRHTSVQWFPWVEGLLLLCRTHPTMLEPFAWLSKHEAPEPDQLTEVLGVLLGAWTTYSGQASIFDVVATARKFSPTLIRPPVSDEDARTYVRDDFVQILAGVDNFSYSIVKGFFAWEARHPNGGRTCGIFPQDCLSAEFRKLQEHVVKLKPSNWDELEEELL